MECLRLVYLCVFVLSLKCPSCKSTPNNDKIIYPGNAVMFHFDIENATKNNCVENFCDEVENYPIEVIVAALERNSYFKSLLEYSRKAMEDAIPINQRGSFDKEPEQLCKSQVMHRTPLSGRNHRGQLRTILPNQTIAIEKCEGDLDEPCDRRASFPNNYKPVCRQKYVNRRLAILDRNELLEDTFQLPCCCVCVMVDDKDL